MWNSEDLTGSPDRVLILALDSGAGHRVRMESLAAALRQRGIPSVLQLLAADPIRFAEAQKDLARQAGRLMGEVTESTEATGRVRLMILDARDLDPTVSTFSGPVIAVDNLHASRFACSQKGGILFYDTLPHPLLDETFEAITRSILFDRDIVDRARHPRCSTGQGGVRLTFYAGPESFLSLATIDAVDAWLSACESVQYTRVGGPRRSRIYSVPPLTRERYLELLANTDILLTYPGMSYWEGQLLGAKGVFLETGSQVHDRLSEYLSARLGAVRIGIADTSRLLPGEMILDAMTLPGSFDMERWRREVLERPGLDRLVDTIEELWNES